MARRAFHLAVVAVAILSAAGAESAPLDRSASFDIRAQRLDAALLSYARQAGVQVIADATLLGTQDAPQIHGYLSLREGLRRLLSRSGLVFVMVDKDVVAIRAIARPNPRGQTSPAQPIAAAVELVPAPEGGEILVTGTSIHGSVPAGSALISIDRPAIENSGAVNAPEILSTVPQLNSFNMIPEAQVLRSRTQGYALNIHRLGYYATLTLINGHRYVPSGAEVTFVDPGMVPTIALERIEIVPDGASAVYGSDAVAGVVNFVYRRPFTGIEASAQKGFGAGGMHSEQLAVMSGRKWRSGSLLLALEYSKRVPPRIAELRLKGDNRDLPGGRDLRSTSCSPGNAIIDNIVYALPNFTLPRNMCEANPTQQLYPRGSRYTGLLLARIEVSNRAELYVEGTYGHYVSSQEIGYPTLTVDVPATNPYFRTASGNTSGSVQVIRNSNGLFPNRRVNGKEMQFGATLGLNYALSPTWAATGFAHLSQDRNFTTPQGLNPVAAQVAAAGTTPASAFNPFGNGSDNNPAVLALIDDGYFTRNRARNRLLETTLRTDGTLLDIAGGAVKAALGVSYRFEDVAQVQDFGARSFTQIVRDTLRKRNVYAIFGELSAPIVGADNAIPLVRQLRITLSARHDAYPGLRSITNPKVGVAWQPIEGLTLQGSAGTSFVAPNLGALGGSYLIPMPQQNQTAVGLGIINLIHVGGGNADLEPEYARTWSAGARFAPAGSGLRIGLSYFRVDYRNTQYQPQEGLSNPLIAQFLREKYAPGVILNATQEDVAALLQRYKFQGLFQPGIVWTTITTSALVNAGTLRAGGVDFDASYEARTGFGTIGADIQGTRMTKYAFQLLPTVAPVSQLDTQRAPRWTWRSNVSLNATRMSATITWNHSSSYRNFAVIPNERVRQFDTYDLRFTFHPRPIKDVELSLRIQNVLDRKPPYYASALGYDAASASPLGRVWQLAGRVRY